MKKDRGVKRLKKKKLMHVVRVKACSPNLLQKKRKKENNRVNKSTEKKNVVVVTVQAGNIKLVFLLGCDEFREKESSKQGNRAASA